MLYPNIEAERAKNGLSKEGLCELLGITRVTYRNWQMGDNDMGVKPLIKLTRIFNCSADYLLGLK